MRTPEEQDAFDQAVEMKAAEIAAGCSSPEAVLEEAYLLRAIADALETRAVAATHTRGEPFE